MPSIFSKNCILTGLINHYCLVCSKHFKDEEETLAHTLDPLHKQNLNSNKYFEKYKGDYIRKFKGLYFCELCNMTFPTATKVGVHVTEESHMTKKSDVIQVVRKNDDIVAFEHFIIPEEAWNGFIDDTCVICNTEFDDKAAHQTSGSHILKLIQGKVIIGDNTIHRKIDDKLYQCLTCNTTITEIELGEHFNTAEHTKAQNYVTNNNQTTVTNGLENDAQSNKKSDKDEGKLKEIKDDVKAENKEKNKGKKEKNRNKKEINQDKTEEIQDKIEQIQDKTEKNQDKTEENQDKTQKNQDKTQKNQDKTQKNQDKTEKSQDKTEKKQGKTEENQDTTKKNQGKTEKSQDTTEKNTADNKAVNGGKKPSTKPVDKRNKSVDLDEIYCRSLGAKDYVAGMSVEKWCILCERVLDVSPNEHIRSKHHQTLLKMHKDRLENNNNQTNTNSSNLSEFVDKYQKNNVHIDLINETAFCKKCYKNIEFDSDAIDKHIEDHEMKADKKPKDKLPLLSGMKSNGSDKTKLFTKPVSMAGSGKGSSTQSEAWSDVKLEEFAKQHGLTRNRADNSFYCNACSRRLSAKREDLEKHVGAKTHKDNTSKESFKKQIAGKPIQKVDLATFTETLRIFESADKSADIVLNGKYCLNAYGFCLLKQIDHRIICLACDIDLMPENMMPHMTSTKSHMDVMANSPVVASLENEFVREIKAGLYHCGFCCIVENDWEDMLDHLTTEEHLTRKSKAKIALDKYASEADREAFSFNARQFELMFLSLLKNFGVKSK